MDVCTRWNWKRWTALGEEDVTISSKEEQQQERKKNRVGTTQWRNCRDHAGGLVVDLKHIPEDADHARIVENVMACARVKSLKLGRISAANLTRHRVVLSDAHQDGSFMFSLLLGLILQGHSSEQAQKIAYQILLGGHVALGRQKMAA